MNRAKVNTEKRRGKPTIDLLTRRHGTIAKVADLVPCARNVVYLALETPSRYSRVYDRLKELCE